MSPAVQLLQHDFERRVAEQPDAVALVCGAERVAFADLARRARAVGAALRQHGVARGDRVALFLENGVEFVAGMLGILEIGAVFMPVNPMTRHDKLAYMLRDARASAVLTEASLAAVWEPAVAESASVTVVFVNGDPTAGGTGDRPRLSWPTGDGAPVGSSGATPGDLAAIIYTSGSTGFPKGVMLTHRNMVSAARSVGTYLDLRRDDVIFCALPLSFDYGLYQLLLAFRVGARVVVERNFAFPVKALEVMERERVSVFPGVPTMFGMLLSLSNVDRYDLRALRMMTSTAAALPAERIRRMRALFPQATLFSMYGLTECKRVSYLPPDQLDIRPTSVGRGMPGQDCWLVDDAGRRLPNGATGELVIRGPHVMRGYWEKPGETADRLRHDPATGDTVLYSGDLFRTDAEGWLYFVARRDDMIKTRGEKVSPREVENAIHELPGIREVAVVGVADELLGEAVKAFIVLAPGTGLSERDVIRHCSSRLEPFMAPKSVEFVDALPQTDTGKIRKAGLA